MTEQTLEARIRENVGERACCEECLNGDVFPVLSAIRAVLDLHRPDRGSCTGCGVDVHENEIPYPCDTVRAIAEALGVTDE